MAKNHLRMSACPAAEQKRKRGRKYKAIDMPGKMERAQVFQLVGEFVNIRNGHRVYVTLSFLAYSPVVKRNLGEFV